MSKKVEKSQKSKETPSVKTEKSAEGFLFTKRNYQLLILGVVLIALGYLLMIGKASDDPNVFNPDIFSFRRLTLAPILILAGFVVEIFAIMYHPKEENK